jgi:hypothetical protein
MRIYALLMIAVPLMACSSVNGSEPAQNKQTIQNQNSVQENLIRDLSALRGTFVKKSDVDYTYSNIAELVSLMDRYESQDKATSQLLINCMTNTQPSNSQFDGKNVSIGFMCYTGLTSIGYYEIELPWAGFVSPTSNAAAMKKAQKEWQDVLNSGSFIKT